MWGVGGSPGSALCPDSSAVHAQASAAPSGSWGEVRLGESGSMPLSSRAAGWLGTRWGPERLIPPPLASAPMGWSGRRPRL